jgi:hypothetical protein
MGRDGRSKVASPEALKLDLHLRLHIVDCKAADEPPADLDHDAGPGGLLPQLVNRPDLIIAMNRMQCTQRFPLVDDDSASLPH